MEKQAKSKSRGEGGKARPADLEYLFDVPVYRVPVVKGELSYVPTCRYAASC